MVEGIGDEVIQVFGICLVILIFVTAWRSTAIRELPQIRAVFIVDRRSQTVFGNNVGPLPTPAAPPDPGQSSGDNNAENGAPTDGNSSNKPNPVNNEINAFRLSYFSNLQNQAPSPSTSQEVPEGPAPNESGDSSAPAEENSEHSIRIKIKYLNDEQRIVQGNLKELLGQFKRRYFQVELSNNKDVVLIFQGRVLREEETLETIGMYDNCVVHCIFKSGRVSEPENRSASTGSTNNAPADWNLGPLLLATLVAMFMLAWFSYWTYPQLFGITSTILLACLTTIFILAVASLYYPQLFQSL